MVRVCSRRLKSLAYARSTRADIYIASVSSAHNVCAKGYTVAIVSTIIETSTPELEIAPGLQLLGPILEKYVNLTSAP